MAAIRWLRGIAAGTVVALGGLALLGLPPVRGLEQKFGLAWLHELRGARPAPTQVALIVIDAQVAAALGHPASPERWPRTLHAELIDYLARAGARVIVFDLFFQGARDPGDDAALAGSIAAAGNVLLAARIRRDTLAGTAPEASVSVESYLKPLPALADAALGSAPMVFPKDYARIDAFWTFKDGGWETATLPALAAHAQAHDALPELRRALAATGPGVGQPLPHNLDSAHHLERMAERLRHAFAADAALGSHLREEAARHPPLGNLLDLYAGAGLRYFNYYGPPGQLHTLRYDRVLAAARAGTAADALDLRGKTVFVGFSETAQTEQRDNYHTVYTRDDGVDLSGVEIGATALANLLDGSDLKRPGVGFYFGLAVWALLIGLAARLLPPAAASGMIAIAVAGYLGLALYCFTYNAAWWPLVVPLAVQAPAALLLGVWLQYREVRAQRDKIGRLLGMQATPRAMDRLARELGPLSAKGQMVYSACLMSDIEGYTVLGEKLAPLELRGLLNRYLEVAFVPVREHRGVVVDAVGDSMFAVWAAAHPDADLRRRACAAALGLHQAQTRFNAQSDHPPVRARIGLHFGQVVFGSVGSGENLENRVIGDIVNTASRVQSLNKQLGTRMLASAQTLEGVDEFLARPVGRFQLVGKSQALHLFELLAPRAQASAEQVWLCETCGHALDAFTAGDFARSRALWQAVADRFAQDGPAAYYLALCERLAQAPLRADWDGVVELSSK